MSLVSVCKNSKTAESKIEDQNLIIYTKTDEIENWKSDLVLHVRTKLVKAMLVTDIVDRNVLTDFINLIYVTYTRISYQNITPVVPLFATPPFRNTAPFSQHFFREFRCCEKGYHRCVFWAGNFSSNYLFHQIERPEVIDL